MENNTLKMIGISAISFVTGGGLGSLVVRTVLKKKYEEKLSTEIGEMELWYEKKVNELCEKMQEQYDYDISRKREAIITETFKKREKLVPEEELEEEEEEQEKNQRMNTEEMKEIREKLKKNWNETTNYAAMYQVRKKDEKDEEGSIYEGIANGPEDDDPEEEDFIEEDKKVKALHEAHQRTKNRAPKIISSEAVSDLPPNIDLVSLRYYQDNDVLITENEELVDDPGNLVGDCLTKYGFDENSEEIIYVMNYSQDTVYEIQKIFSSYEEE